MVAKAQTTEVGDIYELELPKQLDEPRKTKPRTAEDYQLYANVLPSEKLVKYFKHKKALIQEIIVAKALSSKKETTKVTLH